jgi:Fumarylacetoacetate (FAA) hydrolase family
VNDIRARDFQRTVGQCKSQVPGYLRHGWSVLSDARRAEGSAGAWHSVLSEWPNTAKFEYARNDLWRSRTNRVYQSRHYSLCCRSVSTGTPPGAGVAPNPPVFLRAEDEVIVEIDGIGRLSNPVKDK